MLQGLLINAVCPKLLTHKSLICFIWLNSVLVMVSNLLINLLLLSTDNRRFKIHCSSNNKHQILYVNIFFIRSFVQLIGDISELKDKNYDDEGRRTSQSTPPALSSPIHFPLEPIGKLLSAEASCV